MLKRLPKVFVSGLLEQPENDPMVDQQVLNVIGVYCLRGRKEIDPF
jgi:hypothetical protein